MIHLTIVSYVLVLFIVLQSIVNILLKIMKSINLSTRHK